MEGRPGGIRRLPAKPLPCSSGRVQGELGEGAAELPGPRRFWSRNEWGSRPPYNNGVTGFALVFRDFVQ